MKRTIEEAVERHSRLILDAERYIWKHPETGYREVGTSVYLAEQFTKLGYTLTMAGDIPGFFTDFDTGREGPCVLVLGEMDALLCPEHPDADPVTGAAHVCGHNAQSATLLGIAAALREAGVTDGLCGRIRLCAVPAEEMIELGFRNELIARGVIRHYGGKPEFLRRGYFDGADLSLLFHTATDLNGFQFSAGSVGSLVKTMTYRGKSAHAGCSPHEGVNALYAATLGLSAVNALRETFREEDLIRFHPIITRGGAAVNAIPDSTVIESYVRGRTVAAIQRENAKINRALVGAALAMGANVDISDRMGYFPFHSDPAFAELAREAMAALPYKAEYTGRVSRGSTDMGDLSAIMPTIQPYAGGAAGTDHGSDYRIVNPQNACVDSAKAQLLILRALLSDNGARAKRIIADYKPEFAGTADYLAKAESLTASGDRIIYREGGAAVRL